MLNSSQKAAFRFLPSYRNPPTRTGSNKKHHILNHGEQYVSHQGKRQALKNLRNAIGPSILKNPEYQYVLGKIRDLVKDEPEPEYGFLHLTFAAKRAADEAGVTFIESAEYLIQKFEVEDEHQ